MTKQNLNEIPGEWLTAPAESDEPDGALIFVTGRTDVERFRSNKKYSIRIEVTYTYAPDSKGMPDEATAETLSIVTENLADTFRRDKIAVLTGIYTGAAQRNWIFYTANTGIFQKRFNEALAALPTLPITITAENDPDWSEYTEMLETLS